MPDSRNIVRFVVTICAFAMPHRARAEEPERPNFVIIMADDLGYGDLSCYGNKQFETPHLDALARNGLRFTDFHSSGAVCSPTRAGLLTGRYQQRAGIPGVVFADPKKPQHKHGLQAVETTFAEMLSDAGYATAMFGKWHLGYEKKYNPVHNGFQKFRGYVSGNVDYFSHVDQAGAFDWWINDELKDEPGYSTYLINRHSVRYIQDSDSKTPFCLYVAHEAPHYPYQGPNDRALRRVGAPKTKGEGKAINTKRAYREMVQAVDKGVGEIVAALDKKGIADDTLVIFFSDNGGTRNGSNGPLKGHKGSVWEGGHRVCCIASWPGRVQAGTETAATTITLDIMPTLLDYAGLESPGDRPLDGTSMRPVLEATGTLKPRDLFWQHGKGLAVRRGNWKLVKMAGRPAQLFELSSDLAESKNLASGHAKLRTTMLEVAKSWQADIARTATPQP